MNYIYCLLKEREADLDEENWVLAEAKDPRKLQTGGTFRSVIARRMEAVIVPILTEIVAFIDRNYNLSLLWNSEKKCLPTQSSIFQFWLAMFREPQVMRFHYKDIMVQSSELIGPDPAVRQEVTKEHFRCKLPFSWLIHQAFDAQWVSAKSSAGTYCLLLLINTCVNQLYLYFSK